MIDSNGLYIELQAAGILISGCNSNGIVWDLERNEIQDRPDVAAIIAAHNPQTWIDREQRIQLRKALARTTAKDIPNWATWTQAQWAAYRDANISTAQINAIANLTDAKAILNKMAVIVDKLAQMEIALRDDSYPDLPE